jgi:DNA-binding CsgD family transcriptional regulator
LEALSSKEREVVALIGADLSDKHIAFLLGVSTNTVRSHLERIRHKIGPMNRRDLRFIARATDLHANFDPVKAAYLHDIPSVDSITRTYRLRQVDRRMEGRDL